MKKFAKMRIKGRVRLQRRRVVMAGEEAGRSIDRFLIRRWKNLVEVRRQLLAWWILVVVCLVALGSQTLGLSGYYRESTFC